MFDFPKKTMALSLLLGVSAMAGAQTAANAGSTPAAGAQAQAGLVSGSSGQATHRARKKQIPLDVPYYLFITETARDHRSNQQETRDDPRRFPPDMEDRNMSAVVGIQPEEWETVLTYVMDADEKIQENESEWRSAVLTFHQSPGYVVNKSVPPPQLTALERQWGEIINGTIDSLKKELGDASFVKLNAYVLLYWGGTTGAVPTSVESQRGDSVVVQVAKP